MEITKGTCVTHRWHYLEMSKATWKDRMIQRMAELNLKPADVNRLANIGETGVHDMLKRSGSKGPSIERAIAVARVLQIDLSSLFEGSNAYSLGLTLTGAAREGGMWTEIAVGGKTSVPLELFNEDVVKILITDNSLAPCYRSGDVLVGKKFDGNYVHNLLGKECIIRSTDSGQFIGILSAGKTRGKYTVSPIGDTPLQKSTNITVEWAAPIQVIVRDQG